MTYTVIKEIKDRVVNEVRNNPDLIVHRYGDIYETYYYIILNNTKVELHTFFGFVTIKIYNDGEKFTTDFFDPMFGFKLRYKFKMRQEKLREELADDIMSKL